MQSCIKPDIVAFYRRRRVITNVTMQIHVHVITVGQPHSDSITLTHQYFKFSLTFNTYPSHNKYSAALIFAIFAS